MDEKELKKIVQKHCKSLNSFLHHKPIAKHTSAAFEQIVPFVDPSKKIILDSGCGTARSTMLLGKAYPNHTVIGVDRSFVRLTKNQVRKEASDEMSESRDENPRREFSNIISKESSEESQRPFQAVSSNTLLVRAELTDFWRCCINANWDIDEHYILYPNPYPKKNRVKKRFYAHPSFPLILGLGANKIIVRSNWEGYLKEFANSVEYAHELYACKDIDGDGNTTLNLDLEDFALPYLKDARNGPVERTDKAIAWTNFERKYDNVGEKTYSLILNRKSV